MLDTSQTELAFSVVIKNTNPFVDFFNLPKCGMNAFLKEFRLMVNGNAVEKNTRYGLSFEDAMNKMGINSEPYEMFRSNEWCPTDSRFHVNMIKPSMVDSMGNPMYRSDLFRDKQQIDQHFFGHANVGNGTVIYSRTRVVGQYSEAFASVYEPNDALQEKSTQFSRANKWSIASGLYNLDMPQTKAIGSGLLALGSNVVLGLDTIEEENDIYNRGNHTVWSPADWPFYQPGIAKPDPPLAQSRWQDIARFYANVKNIPIGMFKTWSQPSNSSPGYGENCFNANTTEFVASSSDNIARTEFRVSTPLLSGILGLLTDKFFPDMLVAAGKMWIEFDLQPKEVALQLLMDPCRRIPGTIRDFIPYTGRLATSARNAVLPSITDVDYNTSVNSILQKSLAIPFGTSTAVKYVAFCSRAVYSEGFCIGTAGFNSVSVQGDADANDDPDPPAYEGATSVQEYNNITGATGIPIPQYCFSTQMWTKKKATVAPETYVSETEACYGTYLRSAVAQTRRTGQSTNCSSITTSYGSYDTDYEITNVILYTEQIIVPDEIASQLLLSARSGAISYHTTMVGATYNNAPTTTSQNLILTVTGASVNNVTFLFQSNAQLSGSEAFAYNSFASYNPWCKLDFDASADANVGGTGLATSEADVGGKYTLTNPLYTKNSLGLNLFLKIGNELIPRQAINDIPSFMVETQKGMQTLSDYAIQLDMQTHLVPTWKTNDNTSYLQYDVLRDGFLACFVEAKALDDQTLTGNPYLNIIGVNKFSANGGTQYVNTPIAARRRGPIFSTTNTSKEEYHGVLNAFKPFEGNFRMCFNLATFETQTSARCGTPIVNNQLFLQGDNFHFMSHKVAGGSPTVCVTALYEQDAKVVFEQGGNCLVFM
jgi:hypothetical protein